MALTTNLARRFYFLYHWKADAKKMDGKKLQRKLDAKAEEFGYKNWPLFHLDVIRLPDAEFEAWISDLRAAGKLPSYMYRNERTEFVVRKAPRDNAQLSLKGM